jgi:ribosome-associated protein
MSKRTAPREEQSRSGFEKQIIDIAEFLRDRKARDILVLDLQGMTTIADYFVICTVTSAVQSRAILRELADMMDRYSLQPLSRDAGADSPWVLLDYNYFIIHIFLQEGRDYYRLEKLWSDAEVIYSHRGDSP